MIIKKKSFVALLIFFVSSKFFCQDSLKLVAVLEGTNRGDKFGRVKGAGDINGDGYDDFFVGSSGGYARLYLGNIDFDTSSYIKLTSTNETEYSYGSLATGIGDINSDGYDDFAIACTYFDGIFGQGRFHVYYGGAEIDLIPDFTYNSDYHQEGAGPLKNYDIDINKDGYDDFLVISPYNWTTGKGRVKLFWGGESFDEDNVLIINAPEEEGDIFFGESVEIINDINGDGYEDILISSNEFGEKCKVYVYYGGPNIDNIYDDVIAPVKDEYNFGIIINSVSNNSEIGKINFIIGSDDSSYTYYSLDSVIVDSPKLYGVGNCGDINNDNSIDLILCTDSIYIYDDHWWNKKQLIKVLSPYYKNAQGFGKYFNSTTDINNDGYNEVIISAPYSDSLRGSVYIFSYQNITSIDEKNKIIPRQITLSQNYPNPFNPTTKIEYQLPKAGHVTLKVFNMLGQEVASLVNEVKAEGRYLVNFNAKNLASGTYIYTLNFPTICRHE
ncbi:MAG: VCBS repeat-containing protein [Melioribacteraceae bacterium]|nr:VCBS repeat-containing protein [Melioribacteraceae bacterium]